MWKHLNQNASLKKPSKLHEVTNDFYQKLQELNWTHETIFLKKQVHHKFKTNNVRTLKV